MNHGFTASNLDTSKCRCGRTEIEHTARATCDSCGNTGNCELIGNNLLLCTDCYSKEKAAMEPQTSSEVIINLSKKIDQTIQIREDIYNTEMVSIKTLRVALEADPEVKEKHFTLSRAIEARFNHLTTVLTEVRDAQTKALNQQRALQTFWQDLAKQLSAEQREQIKLKDINYQPIAPKLTKPSAPKIAKPYSMGSIKIAAAESKIDITLIANVCNRRNVSAIEAVRILRELGL